MSIVFSRIFAYSKNNKVLMQPLEKRIEIGKLVAEAYHQAKVEIPLKRKLFKEEGIVYNVLYYPPVFTPQLDAIISKFYQDNPVLPPPAKKERKRIPAGPRKVATSKTYTQ